jgi:hypothetical protein
MLEVKVDGRVSGKLKSRAGRISAEVGRSLAHELMGGWEGSSNGRGGASGMEA